MRRLTLYTTLITGQLAFAAASFLLQAQPNISDTKYLKNWNSLSPAEKTDAAAMIASAPKGTANTFDYYKNLIDRNADNIPNAITNVSNRIGDDLNPSHSPTSLYGELTFVRNRIGIHENLITLRGTINEARHLLTRGTQYHKLASVDQGIKKAKALLAGESSPFETFETLFLNIFSCIGSDGDFALEITVYSRLALALTKLNEKTGKPKPTITQALDELDKMSLGNCEQYKTLVDKRSTTKTLQAAINAVNGQPKHATNKTYGLLGNLKTTATANGTPLAEHDIYRRLKKGIDHLNTLLDARVSEWPDPHPENIGAIISHLS